MDSMEDLLEAEVADATIGDRVSSGVCKDAANWLDEEDEQDNPLVENFIEVGEVFAMVGQAKAGKSLLALQLGVCIAMGIPFCGMPCTRHRVYIANLEVSAKQYKKRLRRICDALGTTHDRLRGWLLIDNMKGESASFATVLAMCKAHNCDVAIVDPFYQIAHIVETDEQQCLDAVEEMKCFAKAKITLGVVFHSPKGFSGDRQLIDMISGSSILARFPESVIGLLNHSTIKTARVVDAVLRNYPPPEPFSVSTERGLLELDPTILPEVATSRNAWRRVEQAERQRDLSPFIMDVLKAAANDAASKAEPYRGMPVGVLADKARKAYIEATGKALGEKRMPTEIKTLSSDGKIVVTDRIGKDGVKLAGTPEVMKWWTERKEDDK